MLSFQQSLARGGLKLNRRPVEILQINVGKFCNQACSHCHVEAGPKRTERMEAITARRLMELLDTSPSIHTVDITGGAPELNPHFRYLVRESVRRGKRVTDRCNLTVLFEKGQEDTGKFLRDYRVQIVASLPCYSPENVDRQRGGGVFEKSIRALRLLNDLGYGKEEGLELNLVYNPMGAFLPPPQEKLEADYKRELRSRFGITFNGLFTLANMPIKRFLDFLVRTGQWEGYMNLLADHFNPQAAEAVMCRNLISIGWDGQIFDCDFNQMLDIPAGWKRRTVWDIASLDAPAPEKIAFANHCYGCTAGAGSSCGGALL